jgi:hypothetical protein
LGGGDIGGASHLICTLQHQIIVLVVHLMMMSLTNYKASLHGVINEREAITGMKIGRRNRKHWKEIRHTVTSSTTKHV